MIRVGFFVYAIDARAGMQRQASELLPRLAAAGLDVKVVSTVSPGDLRRYRGRPVPRAPELPVTRIPITRRRVFEALARTWLAREGGVDVLLGLGWHEAVHAARISARTRVPFVVRYACSGEHGDLAALAKRPEARSLLAGAARHVCISEAIRTEALAAGLPSERLVSIPNGVDRAAWSREVAPARDLPWGEEAEVLLFVGRLARQKRVDVLLEAFARLERPRARLVIAGEGPLRGALVARAEALGVADRVAFLGVVEEVAALHARARVFVLPSEGEGMPNVLLEALAAGTPVVATDVAGTRDVARQEREALLVPVNDAGGLAAALERLLADASLRERLRVAGRARVAEAFDIEVAAKRYVETLERAACEGAGARAGAPELAGRLARRLRERGDPPAL